MCVVISNLQMRLFHCYCSIPSDYPCVHRCVFDANTRIRMFGEL